MQQAHEVLTWPQEQGWGRGGCGGLALQENSRVLSARMEMKMVNESLKVHLAGCYSLLGSPLRSPWPFFSSTQPAVDYTL